MREPRFVTGAEKTRVCAHQSSDARKSLQSARIMSLTPGSSTIELIGRFCRAPFHRQQPYELSASDENPRRAGGGRANERGERTYVSAMKMCTRCSASFSYSRFASSTSRLRMSLFRATTLRHARVSKPHTEPD